MRDRDLASIGLLVVVTISATLAALHHDPVRERLCEQYAPTRVRLVNGQAIPTDYRCLDKMAR